MSEKPNNNKEGNSKKQKKNKLGKRVDEPSSEDQDVETSELQVANVDEQTEPRTTRSREAASRNVPEIKVQDTDTSVQASTSATGAIPKTFKPDRTITPVQLDPDDEKQSDGAFLLNPEEPLKQERSPRKYVKSPIGLKQLKNKFFPKKISEDVKTGPVTRSQTKTKDVSESSGLGAKSRVEELNKTTNESEQTKSKALKKLFSGLSSKKSSKSKDRLPGSYSAVGIEELLDTTSVSVDDSSENYTPPITEEYDVSSLASDEVTTPLSRLSTDSPARKTFPDPVLELNESESDSESET